MGLIWRWTLSIFFGMFMLINWALILQTQGDRPWVFFGGNDSEAETPVLRPPHAKSWLIGKDPDAGRDWGQEEKGMTEDEMAGWHHWLDGCGSEWTPGAGNGQGGLACCDSWGLKESDTTEGLSWTELKLGKRKLSSVSSYQDWLLYLFIYLAVSGLNCGMWALEHMGLVVRACGILVPQLGIKPMACALECRFLTTGPRGKSHWEIIFNASLWSGSYKYMQNPDNVK